MGSYPHLNTFSLNSQFTSNCLQPQDLLSLIFLSLGCIDPQLSICVIFFTLLTQYDSNSLSLSFSLLECSKPFAFFLYHLSHSTYVLCFPTITASDAPLFIHSLECLTLSFFNLPQTLSHWALSTLTKLSHPHVYISKPLHT